MSGSHTTFAHLIQDGILSIGDGYRAKNEELGGDGPIFLRAGHVTDAGFDFDGVERFTRERTEAVQSKMSRAGDVVITTKGNSTGRVAYVTPDLPSFVYSPHLSYWRSNAPERLQPGFLRYWSRSREFHEQLGAMKVSTDMAPYLSLQDQRRLRITIPARQVQCAIAEVLGALDDKIELNRRTIATLNAIADESFSAWIDDSVEGTPARSVEEWMERGALTIGDGYRAKNTELSAGGLPFARAADVDGIVRVGSGDTLAPDRVSAAGEKISQPLDVVVTTKGTVGRMAQVAEGAPQVVYSPQLCYWRVLDRTAVDPHVLYRWMRSRAFGEQLERYAGQTDMAPYVNLRDQRSMTLRLPDAGAQASIAESLRDVDRRIACQYAQCDVLAEARDALLPRLLSGELRVRDAERALVEAGA